MKKRLLLPLLFATSYAVCAAGGRVTFSGAVIDDTCKSANTQRPALHCTRGGVMHTLPLQLTARAQALPYNLGSVHAVHQRSVQIVTVNYH